MPVLSQGLSYRIKVLLSRGSGFYLTPTRFHRWLQRHGLYGSTTHILNTAKGKGQKAVSMKPEEKVLASRPTRPHTGVGCTLQLVPQVLAEHRNTGFITNPYSDSKTKGLSSLSYVQDFRGLSSTPSLLILWG